MEQAASKAADAGTPPVAQRARQAAAAGAGVANTNTNTNSRNPLLRNPKEVRSLVLKYRTASLVGSPNNPQIFNFPPDTTPSAECIQELQKHILFDKGVVDADPGYYTWLLKDIGTSRHLISAPLYSGKEIGTLHVNLDGLTEKGKVLIAGELWITTDKDGKKLYIYNILSGTYSFKLPEDVREERSSELAKFLGHLGVVSESIVQDNIKPLFDEVVKEKILPNYMITLYTDVCKMEMLLHHPSILNHHNHHQPKDHARAGHEEKLYVKEETTRLIDAYFVLENHNRISACLPTLRRMAGSSTGFLSATYQSTTDDGSATCSITSATTTAGLTVTPVSSAATTAALSTQLFPYACQLFPV
jgi:hypothetical protein